MRGRRDYSRENLCSAAKPRGRAQAAASQPTEWPRPTDQGLRDAEADVVMGLKVTLVKTGDRFLSPAPAASLTPNTLAGRCWLLRGLYRRKRPDDQHQGDKQFRKIRRRRLHCRSQLEFDFR